MNTKLLINGKLVAGAGAKQDVLDPATGAKSASHTLSSRLPSL